MPKRVKVTQEDKAGRNTRFHDNFTGEDFTRAQFNKKIKSGYYAGYEVKMINGVETPVSKPDKTKNNNLG
ncbi:hypothetical protein RI509_13130 [Levilactobacillus namurensis]|uniref:hypothetical protein n=1 Tax=Levilactobacillus namurensis TaxID=380393 RepID=UPI0028B73DC2|nr:hypothetical protein [Levilactobacillus namurensis]MDT7020116.1 hypothetical protein [Levilactobacillus namurensis]